MKARARVDPLAGRDCRPQPGRLGLQGGRRLHRPVQCRGRAGLTGTAEQQGAAEQQGRGVGGSDSHVVRCLFVPASSEMPKLKTRKAAAKRFKVTGSGKFLRRRAFRNHLLDHKSPKRKRYLGTMAVVDERDADNVALMLPYGS